MDLDYILLVIGGYEKNAKNAEKVGDLPSAKQYYDRAAQKYREAAAGCPERRKEFLALAEKYENIKLFAQTSDVPVRNKPFIKNAVQNNTVQSEPEPVVNTQSEQSSEETSIEEALAELNGLIGLKKVKDSVASWVDQIKVFKMRKERGMKRPEMSYHLVFQGNPGTGKTTVARLMAKIYHALGILSKGQVVEVDRGTLVADHIGGTETNTRELLEKARGGILFIDEAYSLNDESGNDFGHKAIDLILKEMEDNRGNFVVIAAGYSEPMEGFISSNPGLRSRFKNFIDFSDYTGEELYEIFKSCCDKDEYVYGAQEEEYLKNYFATMYANRGPDFGNGRDVRNFFEKVVTKQSRRVARMTNKPTDEELMTIKIEDIIE